MQDGGVGPPGGVVPPPPPPPLPPLPLPLPGVLVGGALPPPPDPVLPTTTGDRRRGVQREKRPKSTRNLSRVVLRLLRIRPTASGTTSTRRRRVARRGLTNAERPFGPWKMTVLRRRRG